MVQLTFDIYIFEVYPEMLIGDRAYDSDPLDDELGQIGFELIAQQKRNRRKNKTQDDRSLRRYTRRRIVERLFQNTVVSPNH